MTFGQLKVGDRFTFANKLYGLAAYCKVSDGYAQKVDSNDQRLLYVLAERAVVLLIAHAR